jgi:hypothetical protein
VGIGTDLQSHPPMALFKAGPRLNALSKDLDTQTNEIGRYC